jgi:hypothetical protein
VAPAALVALGEPSTPPFANRLGTPVSEDNTNHFQGSKQQFFGLGSIEADSTQGLSGNKH